MLFSLVCSYDVFVGFAFNVFVRVGVSFNVQGTKNSLLKHVGGWVGGGRSSCDVI